MCCINKSPLETSTLNKTKLQQLYQRKCIQLERAKATANTLMYALYKAEADLLKTELNKL